VEKQTNANSGTYDLENNLTGITDAAGRREAMAYDAASRLTSYTSAGGNSVSYDYNKLNTLVEKSYTDAAGQESAKPVGYAYDALAERTSIADGTGDTEYTYDALGRIASVTTYRTPEKGNGIAATGTGYSHAEGRGDAIGYAYDSANNLGSINEPLTQNRYNYCISSYPNYMNPSGNTYNEYHPQAEMMEYMYWLTGDEKYSGLAEELYGQQIEMEYYEASTSAGVVDSVLAAAANTVIFTYNVVAMGTNLTQSLFARELGSEYGDRRYEYPVPLIPWDTADNYLENNASKVWNMESYHKGRCGGDVLVIFGSLAMGAYGIYNLYNGMKNVPAWVSSGSNGSRWLALTNGGAVKGSWGLVANKALALDAAGIALADGLAYDALGDFRERVYKIAGDKGSRDGSASSWGKGPQISDHSKEVWGQGNFDSVEDSLRYHFKEHGKEVGAADIDQYVRKAENFRLNIKGARKSYPPDGTPGAIRYTKNGKYIIIGPDKKILSFGLAR